MFFRKAVSSLDEWMSSPKKALMVVGARQVGKTTLIETFCQERFSHVAKVNFANTPSAVGILLEAENLRDFETRLSLLPNVNLGGAGSVLFFDELQEYYVAREKRIQADPNFALAHVDILTLAKEIAIEREYRLILSGSMLGATLFTVNLTPTGFVDILHMYPMDFEEFLLASGVSGQLIDTLKERFGSGNPLDKGVNDAIAAKYREYLVVGGMPEAVSAYFGGGGLAAVRKAHQGIDAWYRADIAKYARVEDRLVISEMYDRLPSEIASKNRKFVKSHLETPDFKNLDLKDRYLWLSAAGIALPVHNVTNPAFPLKLSEDSKLVKLFASDVGLLSSALLDDEGKRSIMLQTTKADLGAIYENAVAQELFAHGRKCYYHSLKKEGEIDFMIEKGGCVIPIEVKSGKGGEAQVYSHPSLNKLLSRHSEIDEAYVFGDTNLFSEGDRIKNRPLYMAGLL